MSYESCRNILNKNGYSHSSVYPQSRNIFIHFYKNKNNHVIQIEDCISQSNQIEYKNSSERNQQEISKIQRKN